jgi:hypothetical protein
MQSTCNLAGIQRKGNRLRFLIHLLQTFSEGEKVGWERKKRKGEHCTEEQGGKREKEWVRVPFLSMLSSATLEFPPPQSPELAQSNMS